MRRTVSERHEALQALLRKHGPLPIPAIAKALRYEDSNVRKDLTALQKIGAVERAPIYIEASHGRGKPSTVGWRVV